MLSTLETFDAPGKLRGLTIAAERALRERDGIAGSARVRAHRRERLDGDAAACGLRAALEGASAAVRTGPRTAYRALADLDALVRGAHYLGIDWNPGAPCHTRFRQLEVTRSVPVRSVAVVMGREDSGQAQLPADGLAVSAPDLRIVPFRTKLEIPLAGSAASGVGHVSWTSPGPLELPRCEAGEIPILELAFSVDVSEIVRLEVRLSGDGARWGDPIVLIGDKRSHLFHLLEPRDLADARYLRVDYRCPMEVSRTFFGCSLDVLEIHVVKELAEPSDY